MVDHRIAGTLPNSRRYDEMSQQIMHLIHLRADDEPSSNGRIVS